MRKTLNTFLIVVVGLLAFVGCSPQSSGSDDLVSAAIISTDKTTRALVTEVNFDINNVKAWKYTAVKADNGLNTGATGDGVTNAKQLRDSTSGDEVVKGTVTDGLSQGNWNFTLYGYSDESFTKLICVGSVENQLVTEAKTPITIVVKPTQSTDGKGSIVISEDIKIVSEDGLKTYASGDDYTMSYEVFSGTETQSDTNKVTEQIGSLKVGSYTAVIKFKLNGTEYVAAKAEKTVNVYDNLTTTVYGTITEELKSAALAGEGVIVAAKTETISGTDNTFGLSMSVNSTPVGSDEMTTIVFPDDSLTLKNSENRSVKLTVKTTSIEKASTTYTVANNGFAVAGFELSLEGADISSSLSDDNGITITSFIEPGLDDEDISIVYNGTETEGQKSAVKNSYNSETGELNFTVYHFSEYIVASSKYLAYDYNSLTNGKGKDEIKVIKDISLSSPILLSAKKDVYNINLNGHTISSSVNPFKVQIGTLNISGKGTIRETSNDSNEKMGAILVTANQNASGMQAKVSVGEDVTLDGANGIMIDGYSGTATKARGVDITMNGKVPSTAICGIYINGKIKDMATTTTKLPRITLDGAKIEASRAGIYAAGYAIWTIKGATEITSGTALSLRSGTFTIEGGNFTSTGAYGESLTDDSNSAVLTGAALSMTSNSSYAKKLDVTVSGGTFKSTNGYAVYEGIPSNLSAVTSYVTLAINDGKFTGNSDKGAVSITAMTDKKVIKGGTFSSNPSSITVGEGTENYLADGYEAVEEPGNVWKVKETQIEAQ